MKKVTLTSGSEWTQQAVDAVLVKLMDEVNRATSDKAELDDMRGRVVCRFNELASRNRSTANWKLEAEQVEGKITEPEDYIYEYSVWRDQALAEMADTIRDEALKVA